MDNQANRQPCCIVNIDQEVTMVQKPSNLHISPRAPTPLLHPLAINDIHPLPRHSRLQPMRGCAWMRSPQWQNKLMRLHRRGREWDGRMALTGKLTFPCYCWWCQCWCLCVTVAVGDWNNEEWWQQAWNGCWQWFNNDGRRKMMKISIWVHIEHEMTMKNQCWMVDGGERSMSSFYFSRIHSSTTY